MQGTSYAADNIHVKDTIMSKAHWSCKNGNNLEIPERISENESFFSSYILLMIDTLQKAVCRYLIVSDWTLSI